LFSDFVRQISPDDDTIEKIITPLLRHQWIIKVSFLT
jgi:hypothetical protein